MSDHRLPDVPPLDRPALELLWQLQVGQSPLVRLRAIAHLRERLNELEVDAVAVARSAGMSWAAIGDAALVPRQVAHRRWARAGDAPPS